MGCSQGPAAHPLCTPLPGGENRKATREKPPPPGTAVPSSVPAFSRPKKKGTEKLSPTSQATCPARQSHKFPAKTRDLRKTRKLQTRTQTKEKVQKSGGRGPKGGEYRGDKTPPLFTPRGKLLSKSMIEEWKRSHTVSTIFLSHSDNRRHPSCLKHPPELPKCESIWERKRSTGNKKLTKRSL